MLSFKQYRQLRRHAEQEYGSNSQRDKLTNRGTASRRSLSSEKGNGDDEVSLDKTAALSPDHSQTQPSPNGINFQTHHASSGTTTPDSNPSTLRPSEEKLEKNEKITVVEFDGPDDPYNPQNWSYSKKWVVTCVVGSAGFVVSGASAIDADIVPQAMRKFQVGEEVALLATTLFMVAFGLGSLISAPFSEVLGRNPVYIVSLTIFGLFTIGAGLAPNIQSWLACRFFAGIFGCAPLTNFGGTTADLWSPLERTYIFPVLCCLTFLGPFLAPLVADFIGPSQLVNFQWTEWLTLILTGVLVGSIFLFAPETYAPVILRWKAKHVRHVTGIDTYRSKHELDPISLARRLLRSIAVPVRFLLTEPIVDCFSLYLVIIYIILFGFLPGYDFIFGDIGIYGFDQNHTGLCYIAINVGFVVALAPIYPVYQRFKRKDAEAKESGNGRVVPEERLVYAMIGAPWLPISLFWMGWTSWSNVSYWSPIIASAFFGFGVMEVFISCYQYIIDSYEGLAASALVGMTLTRYIVSGPMVIVSVPMYENLGVHWSLTLLGCLATVMAPVPYVFYRYGAVIRQHSTSATDFS